MTGVLWAVLAIIGGFGITAFGDMVSEEVRDRLDGLPRAILRLASLRLGPAEQEGIYEGEWLPELIEILKGDEARPVTRLFVGVSYAFGILVKARRIARDLSSPAAKRATGQPIGAAPADVSPPAAATAIRHLAGRERFLVALAGGRSDILAFCPSELSKFETLGMATLLTGSLATAGIWFALDNVLGMSVILAFPAACFGGLILTGLQRWTFISFRSEGKSKFAVAVPWLLFAMLAGAVLSTPIAVRIFESEINYQISAIKEQQANAFLNSEQHSAVQARVTAAQQEVSNLEMTITSHGATPINSATDPAIGALDKQLASERSTAAVDYKTWQCQLYGGCSAPEGNGPLAESSHQRYMADEKQITSLASQINTQEAEQQASRLQQAQGALPGARSQLAAAQAEENELQNNFFTSNASINGLVIRLEALGQLSTEKPILGLGWGVLFLLFLFASCMPVVMMLTRRPGIYEAIVAAVVRRELDDALQHFRREYR
jgi:hypothetical protein